MKPGKKDIPIRIKISGIQLDELQRHSWHMCEAFGLDTRIDNYKGVRAISFYSWDLDCMLDVLDMVLNDIKEYPDKQDDSYISLLTLHSDLKTAYQETYKPRCSRPNFLNIRGIQQRTDYR
jgi:hypothetical protein